MNTQTNPLHAALSLRLGLGTMFIAHALLKILVFTPAGTAGFFNSIGIPAWFAYPTMGLELIGGFLLILGLKTRFVSLALIPILLGSIAFVHAGNGWLFTNEGGGWEYPAFLVMASISMYFLGDGSASLNTLFNRRKAS